MHIIRRICHSFPMLIRYDLVRCKTLLMTIRIMPCTRVGGWWWPRMFCTPIVTTFPAMPRYPCTIMRRVVVRWDFKWTTCPWHVNCCHRTICTELKPCTSFWVSRSYPTSHCTFCLLEIATFDNNEPCLIPTLMEYWKRNTLVPLVGSSRRWRRYETN